jgi:hypothetical protein
MQGPTADPVERKYIASGLSRDAVPLAVANYGDNPTKVLSFLFLNVKMLGDSDGWYGVSSRFLLL